MDLTGLVELDSLVNCGQRYTSIVRSIHHLVGKDYHELQGFSDLRFADPYAVYPFFFRDGLPGVPSQQITELAIAARIYLSHCLLLDNLVDHDLDLTPEIVFKSKLLLEEALGIFGHLFEADSVFWQYYKVYRAEYTVEVIKEIRERIGKLTPFTREDFEHFARGKAALTKCITTGLALLAKRTDLVEPLEQSQDDFNLATQLMDDLLDWKKDAKKHRWSWLLSKVCLEPPALDLTAVNVESSLEVIGRRLHFHGYADEVLALALEYYQRSVEKIRLHGFLIWERLVRRYIERVANLRHDLAVLRQRELKSHYNLQDVSVARKTSEARDRALEFLLNAQEPDGAWRDFQVEPGLSDQWITAYTVWSLIWLRFRPEEIDEAVNKARRFLLSTLKDGLPGWGFNSYTCIDADSTAFGVLALSEVLPASLIDALGERLLLHQTKDGGFSTYRWEDIQTEIERGNPHFPPAPQEAYRGWTQSHISVSAMSCRALSILGGKQIAVARALKWLTDNRIPNGYWQCYWWNNLLYPTLHALTIIVECGGQDVESLMTTTASWLMGTQNPDGGWGNVQGSASTPLVTALGLRLLCWLAQHGQKSTYEIAAHKAAAWLARTQEAEGCWMASPCMRTPHAAVMEIERSGAHSRVIPDVRRIFTTATVFNALSEFDAVFYH